VCLRSSMVLILHCIGDYEGLYNGQVTQGRPWRATFRRSALFLDLIRQSRLEGVTMATFRGDYDQGQADAVYSIRAIVKK
jgi:hypothetical protein